jgi:AcrR family transcriptional regulator
MPKGNITMSNTADQLREVLATIASTYGQGASPLTVAALCRAAGISRNSLYRYHPQILEELHALRRQQRATQESSDCAEFRRLRAELVQLRAQIPKLAALIDHYFAASTELRTLLERRDREIAELRRRFDTRPAKISRGT